LQTASTWPSTSLRHSMRLSCCFLQPDTFTRPCRESHIQIGLSLAM
jgi:hypothetical protein